ncbi:MAG: type I-E CRISPR-associated protein Cas6/Cse3/CasE [Planctomycetota bacterium]
MFLSLLHVNVGDDPERDQPGRRWLRDIYRVHQRLWMAFPDAKRRAEDEFFLGAWGGPEIPEPKPKRGEAGFLFRIEHDGKPRILIQSARKPEWNYAFQNAPFLLTKEPDVREFDPAPRCDHAYSFRLLANVVRRKSVIRSDGKTRITRSGLTLARKRRTEILVHPDPIPALLPHDPMERQRLLRARWDPWRKWLESVGNRHGFRVLDEKSATLLMQAECVILRNPGSGRGGSNQEKPTEKRYNGGLFNGVLVCKDAEKLRAALIEGIGPAKAFGFGLLSVRAGPVNDPRCLP